MPSARFRFYAELNDFLPAARRQTTFFYSFRGTPAVKDAIESLGVPHTEVDLVLANGVSVGFDYNLEDGDRISVYPVFESLDISSLARVRTGSLRQTRFVLDVHLGKLARLLRMLGFDALYRNDYSDAEIIRLSTADHRVILTRDRGILKHGTVSHGYWVRSSDPVEQAQEVLRRFDLSSQVKPLSRCTLCNGLIQPVGKESVLPQLPPRTAGYYDDFYRCVECGQVYWPGSHYDKMQATIAEILAPFDS